MTKAHCLSVLCQNQTGYFVFLQQLYFYPIVHGSIYQQIIIIFINSILCTFSSLLLSEAGKLSALREVQNKTASVILSSRPIIVLSAGT